jgi:glycosyltransferase involved in cell wall biosynthesis
MKIVFSTDHIYLHGGIEKVLTEKANYFAEILHCEVTILTSQQQNKPSCYPLNDKVKLIDLAINYDRQKSYLNISNLKKITNHFRKRRRFLKDINPDFVLVSNNDFDFFWTPFIHKTSKKIKEYHSSQYTRQKAASSLKRRIINKFSDFIERKYDAIIVLNKDEQSFFKSANTFIIPNPISIPAFQAKLDKKQVLAAGRIAPVKGFERLIEAWSLVLNDHPDWELHIYGEDYLNTQSKLEEQVAKLGIEKNISFKGVTENMTDTMLDYSLYMMTSHTESFSMVIVEALSVGLPTVAFDVPTGPRNLIENNVNGILVDDNNIESYSKIVSHLILDTSKRKTMGIEARESSFHFLNKNIMVKWHELFHKLKK